MIDKKILIIYPETVSTQIAVYRDTNLLFLKNIKHKIEDLKQHSDINDHLEYRLNLIMWELHENDIELNLIELIVARGGILKPVNAGVYQVNDKMVKELKEGKMGIHHTNLGGLLADKIARQLNKRAILADPVVVDEMDDVARMTGHPLFKRKSIFHALNQKFFARRYAKANHVNYNEVNLIVVTVGKGGISVGAHKNGRVIDVNNAFDGEGPFSIKRAGTIPYGDLVRLCFSGEYTREEILRMLNKKGGYAAYLGTSNLNEINDMVASGNEKALEVSYACAYQVSKEIASMIAVLEGQVDAILLTGNIFNSEGFLANVKKRVGHIAEIALYPSVNDIEALAENAYMVLKGEIELQEYK